MADGGKSSSSVGEEGENGFDFVSAFSFPSSFFFPFQVSCFFNRLLEEEEEGIIVSEVVWDLRRALEGLTRLEDLAAENFNIEMLITTRISLAMCNIQLHC